jgi:hypothetical protein
MNAKKLQTLMDQAWNLAVADFNYDQDDLTNSQQQDLNARQDRYFQQLGGDLDEYREKCY